MFHRALKFGRVSTRDFCILKYRINGLPLLRTCRDSRGIQLDSSISYSTHPLVSDSVNLMSSVLDCRRTHEVIHLTRPKLSVSVPVGLWQEKSYLTYTQATFTESYWFIPDTLMDD